MEFRLTLNYMVSVDDFAHEGYLGLVDPQKRMLGVYDGTSDKEVDKLMKDMDVLLLEYNK